jgi:hypothetical protein
LADHFCSENCSPFLSVLAICWRHVPRRLDRSSA